MTTQVVFRGVLNVKESRIQRSWSVLHACVLLPLLLLASSQALAEACIVHSQSDRLDVKVCQATAAFPPSCSATASASRDAGPEGGGELCRAVPEGAFGVCRNSQVSNIAYRQDLYYYGVASDARYLKPFCEGQGKGTWESPSSSAGNSEAVK